MHAIKIIVLGLCTVILVSCQNPEKGTTGSPPELRARARAKRVQAAGLREDIAGIDRTIAGYRERLETIQRHLDETDSRIRELEPYVGELEEEREKLPPYEAYIRTQTLKRWQNRLDTARKQRSTYLSQKNILKEQISRQEDVQDAHRTNAAKLARRADMLDQLAAKLEPDWPPPEPDFWSRW